MTELSPIAEAARVRTHPNNELSLDTLYEVSKLLAGPTDAARMMSPVLNILDIFAELRHGAIALLVKPNSGFLEFAETAEPGGLADGSVNPYVIAATTLSAYPQVSRRPPLPQVVARSVLRTGVSTAIQNVAAEIGPDALPEGADPEAPMALLATPIRERGDAPLVLGVLSAYRYLEPESPPQLHKDLRLLSMVANLLAQSLRFRRLIARDRERLMAEARQAKKALQFDRPAGDGGQAATAATKETRALDEIIGESPVMRDVVERIGKVAPTRATVLLRGESGTGKELFARALHLLSDRTDKPFVKINCAALSETLLESELFGHEKGSFTGAVAQKKGRFELADGGTLFLDEIGEISASFQAKLLRALQEGEFERVGGSKTVKVDVRLVAATNKDLEDAVAKGEFRADLYFRICVIPIVLPPLRERSGDIPRLAEAFLERFNRENGARLRFSNGAVDALKTCAFPGNVRELENCVNRVAALASGQVIEPQDLACHQDACLSAQLWRLQSTETRPVGGLAASRVPLPVLNTPAPPAHCPVNATGSATPKTASERDELIDAMERSGWVQAKAARFLGLTPRQIGYALKKHGVEVKKL